MANNLLANADDWVEMALFAEWNQEYLRKYTELKNGIPFHDTTRHVMGKPCVPIKRRMENHPILFLHGVKKTDFAWDKKQWMKKAMKPGEFIHQCEGVF